jgi:hypothetical protein
MKTKIKYNMITVALALSCSLQTLPAQEALEANGDGVVVNAVEGNEYIYWHAANGGKISGTGNTVSNSGTLTNSGLVEASGQRSKISAVGLTVVTGISDKNSIQISDGASFEGTNINASGGAHALYVSGGNASITGVDMSAASYVAWVANNAYLKLENGTVKANGGVYVYPGSTFDGKDLTVTATGSDAVHLKWGGISPLENVSLNAGQNGVQLESYAPGSLITANSVTVNSVLTGFRIAGPVGSESYAEKNGDLKNIAVTTTGGSGYGILADQGSTVYVDTATIKTSGGSSRGLYRKPCTLSFRL